MKLVLCSSCGDVFNLTQYKEKVCSCGKTVGKYIADGRTVEVTGNAVVFCIENLSFANAIAETGDDDRAGHHFKAWVLPRNNRWRRRR